MSGESRTLRGLVKASSSGVGSGGSPVEDSRVEGVEAGGYRQKVSSGPRGCEGGWSLNHGGGGMNEQSFHPHNLQPRFYSSSAVRPLAPFDSAPPPQFGGAEASVPRPARGTGPNARLRARTRFPPTCLEPNLHAIIASLAGHGVGGGGSAGGAGSAPFIFQFFSALSFLFHCPSVRCCLVIIDCTQAAAYAPDPLPVSWSHSPVR